MKRRLLIILALVVFFIPVSVSFAGTGLDDKGNPNDPATNPRANACFGGGSMEGKCDTEWEWTCGWYLIRYNDGIFSRNQVPATCASLLPAAKKNGWPPAGCYYSAPYDPLYIYWNGNQTQSGALDMTYDCAIGPTTGVGGFFYASAPDPTSAATLCTTNGYSFIREISSSSDTGAWPIYQCQ